MPPAGLGGVKIFITWVGDPFRPMRTVSSSTSLAVQTVMAAFLAAILPLREGRRGSLISLTTVMIMGSFVLSRR